MPWQVDFGFYFSLLNEQLRRASDRRYDLYANGYYIQAHMWQSRALIKYSSTENFGATWKQNELCSAPKGYRVKTVKLSHARSIDLRDEPNQLKLFPLVAASTSTSVTLLHISLFNLAKLRNFNAMLLHFWWIFLWFAYVCEWSSSSTRSC